MARTKDITMIHGAAFYFAQVSRDKKKIASHFGVSERTIERWSKEPEWEQALNAWGYTGERSFTPPPRRDIGTKFKSSYERARSIYVEAFQAGEPEHKLASTAAEVTELTPETIRRWAIKHRWKEYHWENNPSNTEIETFIGASGTPYKFECHNILSEFPGVGAVYLFTRRTQTSEKVEHKVLYIGEAPSLEGSFYDQHNFKCVKEHGGNTLCIHIEKIAFLRRQKEQDLIVELAPLCNED